MMMMPHDFLRAWLYDRLPALRRFDAWANEKERAYPRRRNASLATVLDDAGLHDLADRLR